MLILTGNSGQDAQTSEEPPFSLMAILVLLTYSKGFPLNNLNSQLPFLSLIPEGLARYFIPVSNSTCTCIHTFVLLEGSPSVFGKMTSSSFSCYSRAKALEFSVSGFNSRLFLLSSSKILDKYLNF